MKKVALIIFTVLSLAYVIASFVWTKVATQKELCRGVVVNVKSDSIKFLTSQFILDELKRMNFKVKGMPVNKINSQSVEKAFDAQYYVEDAEIFMGSNGYLHINIIPVRPVMRIFTATDSYYINREGKHVPPSSGFFVDVPVVYGNFTANYPPTRLMPLVDYLSTHPDVDRLISAIEVKDSTNVYVIPEIAGHVINLGEVDNLDSKFNRVLRFYREVLSVKGYDIYDNISVKWNNQIVARKIDGKPRLHLSEEDIGHEEEAPAIEPGDMVAADTTKVVRIVKSQN